MLTLVFGSNAVMTTLVYLKLVPKETMILSSLKDLYNYNEGRDVFLSFKRDVGKRLQKKYLDKTDDEWMHMARSAVILRDCILSNEAEFNGEFNSTCQRNSFPQSLLNFVHLLLNGKDSCQDIGDNQASYQFLN